ncbi:MAG: type II secretion system minor pseudopilin GspJ [Pseudomonadota bacterium]
MRSSGFTLIEVLIAMAITAIVAAIAYSGLSSVVTSLDVLRGNADRSFEINRAWQIISRDIGEFMPRPVRDEFGELEPALMGGRLALYPLSLTRGGWHNPNGHARSHLQRINYRLEDDTLYRDAFVVLDRASDSQPASALLLEGVEDFEIAFLPSIEQLRTRRGSTAIETDNWSENWVGDTSAPNAALAPPAAMEIRLQLEDWGEMRRLYALPPY